MLTPDELCASFGESPTKLTVRMLGDSDILIEGTKEALEFFGKLVLAQAQYSKDCGFSISPHGAGSALFSETSAVGLYIHRLPCMEQGDRGTDVDP